MARGKFELEGAGLIGGRHNSTILHNEDAELSWHPALDVGQGGAAAAESPPIMSPRCVSLLIYS